MKEIGAVLVGCGGVSRLWLEAIGKLPDISLVGLVDLDEARARRRAKEFGLDVATGSNLREMLRRTSPDAVFDCTVPEAHYQVTLQALEFGCHVLGEKPISDNPEHARAMVAAAARSGKVYAVVQNRRYHPPIRRLRAFLEAGAIGKITTVHSDFFVGAHFGGFRKHLKHVLLKDMAIHAFDAARFLTAQDPLGVYCREWNPAGSWYDHGASAVAVFDMTKDIVFSYRGSWSAEGLRTSWDGEWRIIGERGSVSWNGAEEFSCEVVAETPGLLSTFHSIDIPPLAAEDFHAGHAGVIHDFVRALQTGGVPETIGTDNIKSLSMVFAAVESAETGRRVGIKL